jgi:hypothetical protein
LGKNAKQVLSNIYDNGTVNSSVEITCVSNSVEEKLSWNSQQSNSEARIMLFDSQISNVIVEQDQVNEFNLAQL